MTAAAPPSDSLADTGSTPMAAVPATSDTTRRSRPPEPAPVAPDTSRAERTLSAVSDEPLAAAADSALRLRVEAVDSTWMQVDGDGRMLFQGVVPKGDSRSWQAQQYLLLVSGRAHGLRYWFQDQLLGSGRLGSPTQVLRFRATHDGVQLLNSELQPVSRALQLDPERP
jgi:hypothetical protein